MSRTAKRAIQVLGKVTSNLQIKKEEKQRSLQNELDILRQFGIWQEDIVQSLIFMSARGSESENN